MRDVSIIGIGQTQVGEHWSISLRHLALEAVRAALADAGVERVDAVYVGNMLAAVLSRQQHLGAFIADFVGMRGVEALTVEAADASGGAAVRQALLAVASGAVDLALVVGVEKMTDMVGAGVASAQTIATDADYEAVHGVTTAATGALLMRRYMVEHGVGLEQMAGFSVNAHANGAGNPFAMFRRPIKVSSYVKAPLVADPVNLFDSAPTGDGAAAVVLCPTDRAVNAVPRPVRLAASALVTDAPAVHDRRDPLFLAAANVAAGRVYTAAGIGPDQVSVLELHDSFTVMAALQLEAAGYAARGEGWKLANNGDISLAGRIPISTHGGLKARGDVGGATGVYQMVEVVRQLRGAAGDCQVPNPYWGMTLNLGGAGGTAVAHILEKIE
jgi:acetyl-CoA C-acetyltransferase